MGPKPKIARPSKTVCIVVTNEFSALKFYNSFLKYLGSMGWEVHIVAKDEGNLSDLARSQDAEPHHLAIERNPAPIRDLMALLSAIRILRKIKPVIVVSATPKAGLIGSIAALLTGVPVRIYQLWGLRLETVQGIGRSALLALEKLAAKAATEVVANSRSLAAEAEALGIGDHIKVLGAGSSHGIDLEKFDRHASDIPALPSSLEKKIDGLADVPIIGFIGRIHRDKGLPTLLEACQRLARSGHKVALLIVGPEEDGDLLNILESKHPNLEVINAGATDDIRPYLQIMDIHCLPTRREGFPNVVLEASAFGIPTVTTMATGARDSVVDQTTGLLTPVDDAAALATALRRLLVDHSFREKLGMAARDRVEKEFEQELIFSLQEDFMFRQVEQR